MLSIDAHKQHYKTTTPVVTTIFTSNGQSKNKFLYY